MTAGHEHEIRGGSCSARRARDVRRGINEHDLDAGLSAGFKVAV